MPKLAPPSFNGVNLPPDLRRVLEAAMRPAAAALNKALVVGDSLQVWGPVLVTGTGAGSSGGGVPPCEAIYQSSGAFQTFWNASETKFDFDTKVSDTANAVTGNGAGAWKFTAPAAGTYLVNVRAGLFPNTTAPANYDWDLRLYKNGVEAFSLNAAGGINSSSGNGSVGVQGSGQIQLAQGDYIDARLQNYDAGVPLLYSHGPTQPRIEIQRVR